MKKILMIILIIIIIIIMRKMKNKDYDNESLNYDNLDFDYLFKVDNKSELRNKKKEKNNLIR